MADQQPVELILLRQLAAHLTVPIWMMDAAGNLLYYNPSAERLLGASFDDIGPIHAGELADLFQTQALGEGGAGDNEMPVQEALETMRPRHGALRFRGLDGPTRDVEISAIPIEGQDQRFLGVIAFFWEYDT